VVSTVQLDGGPPEPTQESTENEEMTDETDRLSAPGPLREAAAFATLGLLRRSIDAEFRIESLAVFQEFFVLRIDGQRNGLLGLVKIHGGRRR